MMPISFDQTGFTQNVDFIAFDEQMPFAARPATVAVKLRHCLRVARHNGCARQNAP